MLLRFFQMRVFMPNFLSLWKVQTSKIQLCNCTDSNRIYQQAWDFKSAAYTCNPVWRNNYWWCWVGNLAATENLGKSRVLIAASLKSDVPKFWTVSTEHVQMTVFPDFFASLFLLLIFKQQSLNSPFTPNHCSLLRAMSWPLFSYGRFSVRKAASLFSAVFLEIGMGFGRKFYLRKKKSNWRSLMRWRKSGHRVKTNKLQRIQSGVLNEKA